MNYHDFKGKKISKLTLGTAQLGMKYGIANQKGNLSIIEANQIIKNAIPVYSLSGSSKSKGLQKLRFASQILVCFRDSVI